MEEKLSNKKNAAILFPLFDIVRKVVVIILFCRLQITDKAGDILCTSVIFLQVRIALLQNVRFERNCSVS